ncbi:hypothetical protein AMTR_s00061p00147320 [Amborella trichopoda]|uniref:HMA domain-containing protein n=1 Tax=Amborella trichopoda TaxID=13333 RepID=U5DCH9_AMBTC|nr:hypothetical protein AMTR_s00061p00147320 [Amborella trichopoda]
MKREVVIEVTVNCEKCRIQAFKDVSKARGVIQLGLEGEDKSQVMVIGDGVDAAKLTMILRKKVGHTELVSVEENKDVKKDPKPSVEPTVCNYPCSYAPPQPLCFEVRPSYNDQCSIL